jgi:hypothetical protein
MGRVARCPPALFAWLDLSHVDYYNAEGTSSFAILPLDATPDSQLRKGESHKESGRIRKSWVSTKLVQKKDVLAD